MDNIGAKTLRLFDLQKLKLNVPKFSYIDAETLANKLFVKGKIQKTELEKISKKIVGTLNCATYAVRSSALIEDSKLHSFAGQFKTLIKVKPENLAQSIEELINHAYQYLNGKIEQFSILIQEYIEADFAGITFTRILLEDMK